MSKIVPLRHSKPGTPTSKNGNVPPQRKPNDELRSREYLTSDEIERLMTAAGRVGRHRHRDKTMILLAYRHGLRVSELVSLRWSQINLKQGVPHVTRRKNGTPATHPLRGPEIRALRRLARDYPDTPYLFVTERGGPLTTSTVRKIMARAGRLAGLEFPIHPHMLRHSTGYKLANDRQDTRAIQAYLGHRSISNTTRYTELSAERFNDFWAD